MNPLATVLSALLAMRLDLLARFNSAMAKLPPMESLEAGHAGQGIVREIDWARDRIERVGTELAANLDAASKLLESFDVRPGEAPEMTATRLVAAFEAKAGKDCLSAAVAEKKVVLFTDHENALTAAKDTAAADAKTAAETDFNARITAIQLVADRRAAAVTRVGELAAATLTDEVLAGETHEAAIAALEARNAKLKEANITAEGRPKFYSDLIAKPDDETFNASLELLLEAAGGKLAATTVPPGKTGAPAPTTPGSLAATGEGKKVIF